MSEITTVKSVKLESFSIKSPSLADLRLTQDAVSEFKSVVDSYRDFYTTIFLNKHNRKIIIKISGGELRTARIEKIDIEGE